MQLTTARDIEAFLPRRARAWRTLPRDERGPTWRERRAARRSGDGSAGSPPGGRLRGRRARRGDIRFALLALLVERPMHGYEMLRELEQRSGALWRPSAGSVYPTLQLLEDARHVKGTDVDGRRTYAITDTGRAELEKRRRGRDAMPWEDQGGDDKARELRDAAQAVAEAATQVARVASPEQATRALTVLQDARRKLYALLAEG